MVPTLRLSLMSGVKSPGFLGYRSGSQDRHEHRVWFDFKMLTSGYVQGKTNYLS